MKKIKQKVIKKYIDEVGYQFNISKLEECIDLAIRLVMHELTPQRRFMQKLSNINRFRTKLIVRFFPQYIEWKKRSRTGECIDCSLCCGEGNCKYLDKNQRCTIYDHREDNKTCFPEFPIDLLDLKITLGKDWKKCKFRW